MGSTSLKGNKMSKNIKEFGYYKSDGNIYDFKIGQEGCHTIEFESLCYGDHGVRFLVAFDKDKNRLGQVSDSKCEYILFGETT